MTNRFVVYPPWNDSAHFFNSTKLDVFRNSETGHQGVSHPFSSCLGLSPRPAARPRHLVPLCASVNSQPPLSCFFFRHTWGCYYARGVTTAWRQGDPKGKASLHLNNLLHQFTHLHIWALGSHRGTMIHFPVPACVVTGMKQAGY